MNVQPKIETDFAAIKAKQNAAWASGDYAAVGVTLQKVGEDLAEALNLVPGADVLDVAAGNGNATLAFARRWHKVVSTDYVQHLLDKGAARARAEGLNVQFSIADAEALPFQDDSFDAVVSTFGVMFAPNQPKAAAEMLRVCKPNGRIGMANWTKDGFIGQLFKTLGSFVAPPKGVSSPAMWGDETWLAEHFASAQDLSVEMRTFNFRYRNAAHFISVFRELYGPVHKAFLALDETDQQRLYAAIEALIGQFNTQSDGSVSVPSTYAEATITK